MDSRRFLLVAIALSLGIAAAVWVVSTLFFNSGPAVPKSEQPGEVLIWEKGQPLP